MEKEAVFGSANLFYILSDFKLSGKSGDFLSTKMSLSPHFPIHPIPLLLSCLWKMQVGERKACGLWGVFGGFCFCFFVADNPK